MRRLIRDYVVILHFWPQPQGQAWSSNCNIIIIFWWNMTDSRTPVYLPKTSQNCRVVTACYNCQMYYRCRNMQRSDMLKKSALFFIYHFCWVKNKSGGFFCLLLCFGLIPPSTRKESQYLYHSLIISAFSYAHKREPHTMLKYPLPCLCSFIDFSTGNGSDDRWGNGFIGQYPQWSIKYGAIW